MNKIHYSYINNLFYNIIMKRKYIWLTEIIFWFILASVGLFFFIYNTTIKDNVKNSYYLFFEDAGGLVQGSPVRLMGLNIGYVKDVKIFDNKVFVSFLVTRDNTKLPKKAIAHVEFYGLGGSTSLELIPQLSNEDREVIIPSKAYRIEDFWEGQRQASNVLIDIYGSFGRNVKKSDVKTIQNYIHQYPILNDFMNKTDKINMAQSVAIYKMGENTMNYVYNNNLELLNELESESEVNEDE